MTTKSQSSPSFTSGIRTGRAIGLREAVKTIEDANGGTWTPMSEKLRAMAERIERE